MIAVSPPAEKDAHAIVVKAAEQIWSWLKRCLGAPSSSLKRSKGWWVSHLSRQSCVCSRCLCALWIWLDRVREASDYLRRKAKAPMAKTAPTTPMMRGRLLAAASAAACFFSMAEITFAAADALGNGFGFPSGQFSLSALNLSNSLSSVFLSRMTLSPTETLKSPFCPGFTTTSTSGQDSSIVEAYALAFGSYFQL